MFTKATPTSGEKEIQIFLKSYARCPKHLEDRSQSRDRSFSSSPKRTSLKRERKEENIPRSQ